VRFSFFLSFFLEQVKARLEQQNMNSVNTMNPPQTQ
jgi:hypothetical protein